MGVFTIRIAICDNDQIFSQNILLSVELWSKQVGLSAETVVFENGDDLLDFCKKKKTNIILLDIIMPLLNGMDTAKEIRDFDCDVKIIFLTSSPDYAVESYDVKASGYLLKPVSYEKLCNVMNDCIHDIHRVSDTITVHTSYGYQSFYIQQLEFVEAQNKKAILTFQSGESIDVFDTLSSLEQQLTLEKGFFKCHRSYLVNLSAVSQFTATEAKTRSGMRIPIARGLSKSFKDTYFSLMFQE